MIPSRRPAAPLRRLGSRVSRRGLLGAGVLAGVLAASGVPLQARTLGGVLRIGLPTKLHPTGPWDLAPSVLACGAIYETLTEVGPTGDLRGGLALAWEAAPGGAAWHMVLRTDVRFHDGRRLTSSDVAASLLHHRRGRSAWTLSRVDRIEPQGPEALLITLSEGDPDFPLLLAERELIIGPEGCFYGVGTGLYRVAAVQPEDRLRLDRVEAHWKDGRAGWFEAIEALTLVEPQERLAALIAGEVDVAGSLERGLSEEARNAGLEVTSVQGNRQLHVLTPQGASRELIDLLPRGVDRLTLAEDWGGVPAADHPLGLLHPSLVPLDPPPFDPMAARAVEAHGPRLQGWDGCLTEEATFRKALAGPWAPIRNDPQLLRALDAARRTEGEERAAHYAAAQAICAGASANVVVAHVPSEMVHVPALAHGDAVSSYGCFDGGRLPERWWFA